MQNFNDLQRTSRYLFGNEPEQTGNILERSPRHNLLPNLHNRSRWVSLDASAYKSALTKPAKQNVPLASKHLHFSLSPQEERFRQRVSLDYEKLEQIKRRREKSKASPAPQEQILDLVQKL